MVIGSRILLFAVFLAAALVPPPALAAPVLSVQPSITNVSPGGAFLLNIIADDVTDLYAFQFDVGFNPSVLTAESIVEGPFLLSGGATFFIPGAIDNASGTISFTANTLLTAIAGVTGSGTLATIGFVASNQGASPVNLFAATLLDSSLSGIEATLQGAQVTVDAGVVVPEPSLFLPVAALALLLAFLQWKRRTPSPGR